MSPPFPPLRAEPPDWPRDADVDVTSYPTLLSSSRPQRRAGVFLVREARSFGCAPVLCRWTPASLEGSDPLVVSPESPTISGCEPVFWDSSAFRATALRDPIVV